MTTDHVITSHVGSLPRPDELVDLARDLVTGESDDRAGFDRMLAGDVRDVVKRQRDIGISHPFYTPTTVALFVSDTTAADAVRTARIQPAPNTFFG